MANWILKSKETESGPYTWDELLFLKARKKLNVRDSLRREGTNEWILVENILGPHMSRPAISPQSTNAIRVTETQVTTPRLPPSPEWFQEVIPHVIRADKPTPQRLTVAIASATIILLSGLIALMLVGMLLLTPRIGETNNPIASNGSSDHTDGAGLSEAANSAEARIRADSLPPTSSSPKVQSGDDVLHVEQLNVLPSSSSSVSGTIERSEGDLSSNPQERRFAAKGDTGGDGGNKSPSKTADSHSRYMVEPPGETSLFGLSDSGHSFVYLIDCSSSMEAYGALDVAKAELATSLTRLKSHQRFHIVFYNHSISTLSLSKTWKNTTYHGTDSHRKIANEQFRSITPNGGTDHYQALLQGLSFSADVVFLLTDATEPGLSRLQIDDIKARNRKSARIHCIEFGVGAKLTDGDDPLFPNFMRTLASESNGKYTYRDVTKLQPLLP